MTLEELKQVPAQLWRIAYSTPNSDPAAIPDDHVDYFESETFLLDLLHSVQTSGAGSRIISVHVLERVGERSYNALRWFELVYRPPAIRGTLIPACQDGQGEKAASA
jgi:hypothetical protein